MSTLHATNYCVKSILILLNKPSLFLLYNLNVQSVESEKQQLDYISQLPVFMQLNFARTGMIFTTCVLLKNSTLLYFIVVFILVL